MEGAVRKIRRNILCCAGALTAAVILSALPAQKVFGAQDPGTYTVTVTPTYRDPVTGDIEDPGNNEAIGQGMTENLCGSAGLLEVAEDGTTYLTVRYYLDQFIGDVTFEERASGSSSWSNLSYTEMQSKGGDSSATDIHDKYGFTDYRMQIQSVDSTFRGGAYVDPMGRSVIYYFQASNPTPGSGDFITSLKTAEAETEAASVTEEQDISVYEEEAYEEEVPAEESAREENTSDDSFINGSGSVNDPVTGIPQKPAANGGSAMAGALAETRGEISGNEEYHLETTYDLSSVSIREARMLTEPMLEEATGITGLTGDRDLEDLTSGGESAWSTNQKIMAVLLGISGILLIRFVYASALQKRRQAASAEKETENRNGDIKG